MPCYQLPNGNKIVADEKFIADNFPSAVLVPELPSVLNAAASERTKVQIAELEKGQPRAEREYFLTGDKTALKALDDKIAVLRSSLPK